MDSFIYGFTLQELSFPFAQEEKSEVAALCLRQLPVAEFPQFTEMTKHVADGSHNGVPEFEFGFDLLLDGLERVLSNG